MTGPRNAQGETTWGGLAEEVRYWGDRLMEKVKAEISDFYPLIPDPDHHDLLAVNANLALSDPSDPPPSPRRKDELRKSQAPSYQVSEIADHK